MMRDCAAMMCVYDVDDASLSPVSASPPILAAAALGFLLDYEFIMP